MWEKISSLILRNRIPILVVLGLLTAFMAFEAKQVKMSYKFGGILPKKDSTYIAYQKFVDEFSEDGNVLVLGVKGDQLYELENFTAWYKLGNDLKAIHGVDSVFSVAHLYKLVKNSSEKRFDFLPMLTRAPETQPELNALQAQIKSLPFYNGLLYNDESKANLMMVFVNSEKFNSEDRGDVIDQIKAKADEFSATHMEVRYSGLPYIRTIVSSRVKEEINMFILLAALVTSLILFFFFRSFKVVVFSILVVAVGVVWSLGMIALFDYRITLLMALIPPLMIVIGIPNCVYLLNKYHAEYRHHGNNIKALSRVIQKIGKATFMTNATTAMGFATFIFTRSSLLQQFGVVASINIMAVFLISLLLIPIIFSFLEGPKAKHTRHLDKKWLGNTVERLVNVVVYRRRWVYSLTVIGLIIGLFGLTKMHTTGNIVDDLPKNDPVMQDLRFFETNFHGVMPFEIIVDAKKKGAATKDGTLKKIEKLQKLIKGYPEFSKSLSIVDAIKFAKQAFYNGNPQRYQLIKSREKSFIQPYLTSRQDEINVLKSFIDSTRQKTRITVQMADIGTNRMEELLGELQPQIEALFPPANYQVTLTGTSVVFVKGTNYLVKNLFISLFIAIVVIAILMSVLFGSWRMVVVSMIPNIIPLIVTAAIMGYFNISIKPSTILVFSIAFGISVDYTIHYLAKYRQELKSLNWDIKRAVLTAVRETGVSMIYTSVVLFFGFGMFVASNFGGTIALGVLVSMTLLVALLTNLLLLPSMLLSLEKSIITKAFTEPLLEIMDEEEDIEPEELQVKKKTTVLSEEVTK